MKTLLIISILLLFISCNSTNKSSRLQNESILKRSLDTIVGVQVVSADLAGPGYLEKEYFVVIKSDTSNYSCIITENRNTGRVTMRYMDDLYNRMPYALLADDSATVSKEMPIKKAIKRLNYKDQIQEIKLILHHASKDFNLNKLRSIRLAMSSIDELSPSVTRKYLSRYGEKFPYGCNSNAAEFIKSSSLTEDINKFLVPFTLTINKISIDGLAYYIPQNSQNGTKPLLDGVVIFSLIKIPQS